MRRFRRRRLGRGPRRKTEWTTSRQYDDVDANRTNATVDSTWALWPRGTINTSRLAADFDYFEPKDETLERLLFTGFAYVNAPSLTARIVGIGVGLIALDTSDPTYFDRQNYPAGLVPSPISNGDLDWIHRWVNFGKIQGQVGFSTDLVIPTVWATDLSLTSRAKRKLPEGRGLLQCVEFRIENEDLDTQMQVSYDYEYRMLLKLP